MTNVAQVQTEVLVIGFGKGGKTLAASLGGAGRRVVMVEQSDQMYGGTCINIGCVPTKALVHAASNRRAADDPAAWFTRSADQVHTLTSALRAKNFAMLDTLDSVTVVTGRATLTGPHTVEVAAGDDRLLITADTIIINTGATPIVPSIPGLSDSARVVTSAELIARTELPGRLVIIGGGFLGLEFAQMYRSFGSEVTVLEAGPVLARRQDPDVSAAVHDILTGDGIAVVTGATVTQVVDEADGTRVEYTVSGVTSSVVGDLVLIAAGRAPATEGLGLAAAGVEVGPRGQVVVDEHLRTSQPHIFAIGDVNGGPQFTYISLDDSRIVADQLIGGGRRSTRDRVAVPSTTFITPPLSMVGLTERAAAEAGHEVRVHSKAIAAIVAMPRAKIVGESRGLMKFVVDAKTDEILGATLLCVDSQELINFVGLAMRHGVTAAELRDTIYTHPSSSEAFNEVLAG